MDRIKGIAVEREIDRLIRENKWLKVQIPSQGYERICVINQRSHIDGEDYFQVDTPPDLADIIDISPGKIEFRFEFRGSDNIRYQFNSRHWQLLSRDLWISKPTSITRIQKRDNFRVATPSTSNLILQQDQTQFKMRLENISISGALASTRLILNSSQSFNPDVGQQFIEMQLVFPTDIMETPIQILQAQIIRIDKGYQKNRIGYAFHFIEVDGSQKNLLTRVVYHLQRRFLQERIKH